MIEERYSIEVSDDFVEIHGDLTIEEAFDYINFFDKKGYKSLRSGWENSTLLLSRTDVFKEQEERRKQDDIEEERMYHDFFESEKKEHEKTKTRVNELESLIKQLMSEEYQKYKKLKEENDELIKQQAVYFLSQDPMVQKILKNGGDVVCIPDVDFSGMYSDPLEIPNPEEQ